MTIRKVLHVVRSVEGGVPVVVDQLARGLDPNRYEAIVLFDTHLKSELRKKMHESDIKTIDFKKCLDKQNHLSPELRKNFDISGRLEKNFGKKARLIYLSLRSFFIFMRNETLRIRPFLRVIRGNKIDLVHTHSDLYGEKIEFVAAWLAGIPCICHNHGYPEFSYFDKMFSHFVDAFIYVSRDVAEHHISQGKPQSKAKIIHNGLYINDFTKKYDTADVRNEFGVKADEFLIGIVGRIDFWKGHEYFLQAMAELLKQTPNVKGMIIGGFEKNGQVNNNSRYFGHLQWLLKSLHLKDKIIFTGYRSDVPRLISALDVVVHASTMREPFGLVVIEGMAAGKPVVATAAGGVLDIIEDGVNGLLVPCKDSKAMAKAILQIISDRQKAEKMGLAARVHVREKFTAQQQVKALQKLYDAVLAVPR